VELLVVIGIIALLISILLPSLNKARESAKLVQCASNMRQVGLAMQMYTNESKGWLPPAVSAGWYGPYYDNDSTSITWVRRLIRSKLMTPGGGPFTGGFAWVNDLSVPVLNCPNVEIDSYQHAWSYAVPYYIFGLGEPIPNGWGAGLNGPAASKLASLKPAPQVVLLAEAYIAAPAYYPYVDGGSQGSGTGVWAGAGGWDVRHGKRANFLLADGHVTTGQFNGKKIPGTSWCIWENWDTETQSYITYRSQIGLPAMW
jgi:prepilin-type processing-associated H-X9-DG protein